MQKREFDDYSRRFTIKNQIVLEEIKMKITRILLSAVLTAAVGLSTLSFAADNKSKEKVKVKIDGAEITFDVEPEIIDGRTMVPLRKIFEELGALVKWDDETQTVSARKSSISPRSSTLNLYRLFPLYPSEPSPLGGRDKFERY